MAKLLLRWENLWYDDRSVRKRSRFFLNGKGKMVFAVEYRWGEHFEQEKRIKTGNGLYGAGDSGLRNVCIFGSKL